MVYHYIAVSKCDSLPITSGSLECTHVIILVLRKDIHSEVDIQNNNFTTDHGLAMQHLRICLFSSNCFLINLELIFTGKLVMVSLTVHGVAIKFYIGEIVIQSTLFWRIPVFGIDVNIKYY